MTAFFFLYLSVRLNSYWEPSSCFFEGNHSQGMSSKTAYDTFVDQFSRLKDPAWYMWIPSDLAQAVLPSLLAPTRMIPVARWTYSLYKLIPRFILLRPSVRTPRRRGGPPGRLPMSEPPEGRCVYAKRQYFYLP